MTLIKLLKPRSIPLIILLVSILTVMIASAGTAVETSAPTVTAFSPAEGETINSPDIPISLTATDPNLISSQNYYIKVNNNLISSKLNFPGHWEVDTCTGQKYWVVERYDQVTITGTASGLQEGPQNIEVMLTDRLGNSLVKSWTVNIAAPPVFADMSPPNGSTAIVNNLIFVKVSDNSQVDAQSIRLAIDDPFSLVDFTYDPATGSISYNVPAPGLADGNHTIYASAKDMAGNEGSVSWSFTVQAGSPPLTFADEGQIFDIHNPVITVNIKSNVRINETGNVMQVNGQPVDAVFTYKGHWEQDTCTGLDSYYAVDSYNEGTLVYSPASLDDGAYELSVTTGDSLGNLASGSWTFTVAQKPVISGLEPKTGSTLSTRTPAIGAVISDPNGPAVDLASIRLLVDGKQVIPVISEAGGEVTVSFVSGALADDSFHNVSLSAADIVGNTATATWKFYINSKGDMAVDAQSCGSCHALNEYDKYEHSEGPLGVSVTQPNPTHFYSNRCSHCHYTYKEQTCGYCHNNYAAGYNDDGVYIPGADDPSIAAGQDCLYCHSANNGGWVPSSYPAYHFYWVKNMINTGLDPIEPLYSDLYYVVRHDILPLHQAEKGSCNNCHSIYLTREHNRVSNSGTQLNCNTCHSSADPMVQQAIADKNRDCSACHTSADHEAVHNSTLDTNCRTCHRAALSTEHLSNSTTAGKNYDCDTCHANSLNEVNRTIATNSLNCAGCHTQGHNVNFVDKVPADIPLYAGHEWSLPMEASLFTGEPSTPAGYEDGQLVISDRRAGITPGDIWNFYSQELAANGWVVSTGIPAPGSVFTEAEFRKEGRSVTVRCYNTSNSLSGGEPLAAGYRTEIWYTFK
ncbi:MAG: hypothetical protein CVU89_14560 [Firmicutes bacterium HGW-Firmicutes-14]|nr:MAG: hypothetical protein CVU89_14560 [Firmicutes bacterium HGW-Firmicutes-14]